VRRTDFLLSAMTPIRWFAVHVGLFGVFFVLVAWLTYGAYGALDGIVNC
jgi:uncharacterized membrane protein YdcZ (DUF606 family)